MEVILVLAIFITTCTAQLSLVPVCNTCKQGVSADKCDDAYVLKGGLTTMCDVDKALCRKYSGDYNIFCTTGGTIESCQMKGKCPPPAPTLPSLPATECTSCKLGKKSKDCKDPYKLPGKLSDMCKLDLSLCKKYSGDYAIFCTTPGTIETCQMKGKCPKSRSSALRMSGILLLSLVIIQSLFAMS